MGRSKTARAGGRARKSKVEVVVSPEETLLVAKYGRTHAIVPGSRTPKGMGNKTTVTIICKGGCNGTTRQVCTSDLQYPTTAWCLVCVREVKANLAAKKKLAKS